MSFSISGLSSGIDTTSLISQLMAVAAQPQAALKSQLTTEQSTITAYQSINTKLAALQAAADALTSSTGFSATAATSSNPAVVASTTSTATAGSSTTFDVVRLATAQISTMAVPSGGVVASSPANGMDVVDGAGVSHHIALTDGSAASVAAAVNSAGVGVRAAVVNTDGGQILQFTAASTGSAGSFSISGLDSSPQTLVAAQNAQIAVGGSGSGGYTVSSSTNTFNNVIPGVTFSVGAIATGVTVSIASDATAISNKVQALVTAANDALTELGNDTGKGDILESNYQINSITQKILSVVSHGDTNGNSFASVGVKLTSTGTLAFDADAFAASYAADPAGTQATISGSLAKTMSSVASATSTATVAPLISSGTSQVANLDKQISDWDSRLADQQTALQSKYTAMEVALNKLSATSTYLTSALAALDNSSSSSSSS